MTSDRPCDAWKSTRSAASRWYNVNLEAPAVSAMLGHASTAYTLSCYVSVRGDLAATATAATETW